jgi:sulfane dehydrogenase subunit SoxC
MDQEQTYPRADGKSYVVDLVAGACRHADEPAYLDWQHTDRLDNFTAMEVIVKSRCHGHHLEGLAYPITPIGMHYLLIHYDIPEIDEATYRVRVEGLVKNKLSLDMENIRKRPKVTMLATMECAGSGRIHQRHRLWPHVPWSYDAIGTAEWTGTPLRTVLEEAGLQDDAVEILFTGRDKGIQGQQVQYFQRSLSIEQAMIEDVILAYEINGLPLPPQHGFPLRLIVPGWLGMTNVKWLDSIEATSTKLTDRQMKWYSYALLHRKRSRLCRRPGVSEVQWPILSRIVAIPLKRDHGHA